MNKQENYKWFRKVYLLFIKLEVVTGKMLPDFLTVWPRPKAERTGIYFDFGA